MTKTLKELCDKKEWVSVYTNYSDSSRFMFGRILCVNQEEFALYAISPDGFFDGIVAKNTDTVIRVDIGDTYTQKMQKLMSLYKQEAIDFQPSPDRIFEDLLLFAQKNHGVVSIELLESGYDDAVGFVAGLEDGLCRILQIDENGRKDGISILKISDITQISYSSQDEIRILNLWQLNQEK